MRTVSAMVNSFCDGRLEQFTTSASLSYYPCDLYLGEVRAGFPLLIGVQITSFTLGYARAPMLEQGGHAKCSTVVSQFDLNSSINSSHLQ